MKPIRFREVRRRLLAFGFVEVGQAGSHVKFIKVTDVGSRVCMVPKHRESSFRYNSQYSKSGRSFRKGILKTLDDPMANSPITNALTIDFEDWYQGIEIPYSDWDKYEDRIEMVGDKLLKILDDAGAKATFFMLGYVAEKHPEIVKRIEAEGHEIGTHGFSHTLIYKQEPALFQEELTRAIGFLEDLTGKKVLGHRAPFFSITKDSLWALDILGELGIKYDSSIFPVLNYRYGIADAPRFPYTIKREKFEFVEFPISTLKLPGFTMPISGGAYFRIYPYQVTKQAIKAVNREGQPVTFYLHPWELDPDHPRIDVPRRIALTHYFNLGATEWRLKKLLKDFKMAPMGEVLGIS